jgi:SAM-dependent methyltransferase
LHPNNLKRETRRESSRHRIAARALERQLDYQNRKSKAARGRETEILIAMKKSSQRVRSRLEAYQSIPSDARVIEVGSGAHGLIFFFGAKLGVGIDPLAVDYSRLFPQWQQLSPTVAAVGESLPFADQSFDVVICDNVVDHAESPGGIVAELVRILKSGGLLYFTVNFHHPIYSVAASAHTTWKSLGLPYEIGPFADHTVHLTQRTAKTLFLNLPITVLSEESDIEEARQRARKKPPRHLGDQLKRIFFKNAIYVVIARRN